MSCKDNNYNNSIAHIQCHWGYLSPSVQVLTVLNEMLTLQLIVESDLLHQQQDRCFKTKDLTPSSCNSSCDIKQKGTCLVVSYDRVFKKALKLRSSFISFWKLLLRKTVINCGWVNTEWMLPSVITLTYTVIPLSPNKLNKNLYFF